MNQSYGFARDVMLALYLQFAYVGPVLLNLLVRSWRFIIDTVLMVYLLMEAVSAVALWIIAGPCILAYSMYNSVRKQRGWVGPLGTRARNTPTSEPRCGAQ